MRLRFYMIISVVILFFSPSLFAANTLSEAEAKQLASQFYATQGEWAGKFVISRFMKTRFETNQPDSAKVHFQYEWAFIKDKSHTGVDSRYFVYQHSGAGWHVTEMGQHMSGQP